MLICYKTSISIGNSSHFNVHTLTYFVHYNIYNYQSIQNEGRPLKNYNLSPLTVVSSVISYNKTIAELALVAHLLEIRAETLYRKHVILLLTYLYYTHCTTYVHNYYYVHIVAIESKDNAKQKNYLPTYFANIFLFDIALHLLFKIVQAKSISLLWYEYVIYSSDIKKF